MDRRTFLTLSAPALALAPPAAAASLDPGQIDAPGKFADWGRRFLDLPGEKSFLLQAGERGPRTLASYRPEVALFVGSAVKTFILAKYLQKVEAGALSEDELLAIDDAVRSPASPVFGAHPNPADNLAGKTAARNVLEAMIAHSDNTATDAALRRVGVGDVRALIAAAGLRQTRIPRSTRTLFSYLAGAPAGSDAGWPAMTKMMEGNMLGTPRRPVNGEETMMSSAAEMVSYYRRALAGAFFKKPETLTEFRRIQAMADAIPQVVPPGIAAYAKGGSIDWQEDHALSVAGQMIAERAPVTFCFTVNWTGPDAGVPAVMAGLGDAMSGMLKTAAGSVAGRPG